MIAGVACAPERFDMPAMRALGSVLALYGLAQPCAGFAPAPARTPGTRGLAAALSPRFARRRALRLPGAPTAMCGAPEPGWGEKVGWSEERRRRVEQLLGRDEDGEALAPRPRAAWAEWRADTLRPARRRR